MMGRQVSRCGANMPHGDTGGSSAIMGWSSEAVQKVFTAHKVGATCLSPLHDCKWCSGICIDEARGRESGHLTRFCADFEYARHRSNHSSLYRIPSHTCWMKVRAYGSQHLRSAFPSDKVVATPVEAQPRIVLRDAMQRKLTTPMYDA